MKNWWPIKWMCKQTHPLCWHITYSMQTKINCCKKCDDLKLYLGMKNLTKLRDHESFVIHGILWLPLLSWNMSLSMVCDFNVLHLMLGINNLIGSKEHNKVIVHSILEKVILRIEPTPSKNIKDLAKFWTHSRITTGKWKNKKEHQ